MRTLVTLALGLFSLAVEGCGTKCGDVSQTGTSGIVLHLPPESMVSPPETIMASSPMQISGTISGNNDLSLDNAASFKSSLTRDPNALDPSSAMRTLSISWTFVNIDQNNPPNDQFSATVTDASGNVSGQVTKTSKDNWIGPTACQSGYWSGATGSN
jgi:hypothetical protein